MLSTLLLSTLLLSQLACAPGTVTLGEDTSTESDADTDTDTDADTDVEVPDWSVWHGERVVNYEGCKETLTETGAAVEPDWEDWEYVRENCPDCAHVFHIELEPTEACGIEFQSDSYRGLSDLTRDTVNVYVIASTWSGGIDKWDGPNEFDGWTYKYTYENSGVAYDGTVTFPEL